jgi:hypothetical protein
MTKGEMEAHKRSYAWHMHEAKRAESTGVYRAAVKSAVSAWEHIDGMMRYENKYENRDFDNIDAIDLVLKYAPLLFDFRSLEGLEQLLAKNKRIQKSKANDPAEKLATARGQMWANHRLWQHLEQNPDCRQDELQKVLGGEQAKWRAVVEGWVKIGIVRRFPNGGSCLLTLSTRMGQIVPAKCPSCGKVAEAPKRIFLETMRCPGCRLDVAFVFLPTDTESNTQE